jgi:hypothetical protein
MSKKEVVEKCEFYFTFQYADPPSEPDGDATLYTEEKCKKLGRCVTCGGEKECCDIDFAFTDYHDKE